MPDDAAVEVGTISELDADGGAFVVVLGARRLAVVPHSHLIREGGRVGGGGGGSGDEN